MPAPLANLPLNEDPAPVSPLNIMAFKLKQSLASTQQQLAIANCQLPTICFKQSDRIHREAEISRHPNRSSGPNYFHNSTADRHRKAAARSSRSSADFCQSSFGAHAQKSVICWFSVVPRKERSNLHRQAAPSYKDWIIQYGQENSQPLGVNSAKFDIILILNTKHQKR